MLSYDIPSERHAMLWSVVVFFVAWLCGFAHLYLALAFIAGLLSLILYRLMVIVGILSRLYNRVDSRLWETNGYLMLMQDDASRKKMARDIVERDKNV